MDEVLASIRRFVVAGRNSGANFSQQAAASRSIIETSRRLRSGLNSGGIDGPLSDDLRRELDDLTTELLRDAEELLSDVGPRQSDDAISDLSDEEEAETSGAGLKTIAPPPDTLNFPSRRPQTPSPIQRRMADAAMSAGDLPAARRKTLASMVADGDLNASAAPEEEVADLFDAASEKAEASQTAEGADIAEENDSATEIDAVAARRAALRLGRRDVAPAVSSAIEDEGPVWDEDDEPSETAPPQGWGALNNLLRLAENALRDLELHDAARVRRRAAIKARRAEDTAVWFKTRTPGRLTRRAVTSVAAALARPEDRAQRRDAAASDQMARMVAGARARSIRHVWVDSEKRRAEEEATEVLARRARQASELELPEEDALVEPPSAPAPKPTRDRILSPQREVPAASPEIPPSQDNLRRLLRTLEEDHHDVEAPVEAETLESDQAEASEEAAPQLDLGLSEVRTPAPILPEAKDNAVEPEARAMVEAAVPAVEEAAVQEIIAEFTAEEAAPEEVSAQGGGEAQVVAAPQEAIQETRPPEDLAISESAPEPVRQPSASTEPLAELAAFAAALAGELAPPKKVEAKEPADKQPKVEVKQEEKETASEAEAAASPLRPVEVTPTPQPQPQLPPAPPPAEAKRGDRQEKRRRPPLPRDLDSEPEKKAVDQAASGQTSAAPRATGVLSKIEKAVRREAARRAQSGDGPTGREPDPRVKIMLGMDEDAKMAPGRRNDGGEVDQPTPAEGDLKDAINYDPNDTEGPPPSDSVAGAFVRVATEGEEVGAGEKPEASNAPEVEPAAPRQANPEPQEMDRTAEKATAAVMASLNASQAPKEDLGVAAQETLQPLLAKWLDDKLYGIVEQLVREEISKVRREE